MTPIAYVLVTKCTSQALGGRDSFPRLRNRQTTAGLATLFGGFCLLKGIIRCRGSLGINVISTGVRDGLVQCRLTLQSILGSLSALFLGLGLLKGVIDCSGRFRVCSI